MTPFFVIFMFFCVAEANFQDKWREFENEMNHEYRQSSLIKNRIDVLHYDKKIDDKQYHISISIYDLQYLGLKISIRRESSYSLAVTYYKIHNNLPIGNYDHYYTKKYSEDAINKFKMGKWGMMSSSFAGCSIYPLAHCDDYSTEFTNRMEVKLKKIAEEELQKYGDFIFLGDIN